jgi:outer membrane protein TolC
MDHALPIIFSFSRLTVLVYTRWALCFVILCFVSGCTSPIKEKDDPANGPEYVSWLPATYQNEPAVALPKPKEHWWKDFGSEELNGVVDTALKNNFDLRVAVARVAQTRAQAEIVKAAQSPTVDLTGSYRNQGPAQGVGYAPTTDDWKLGSW